MKINVITIFDNKDNLVYADFKNNFLLYNNTNEYIFNHKYCLSVQEKLDFIKESISNSECEYSLLINANCVFNKSIEHYFEDVKLFDFDIAGNTNAIASRGAKIYAENAIEEDYTVLSANCVIIKNNSYDLTFELEGAELDEFSVDVILSVMLKQHLILPYLYMDSVHTNVIDIENCHVSKIEDREELRYMFPGLMFCENYDKDFYDTKMCAVHFDDVLNTLKKRIIDSVILNSNLVCKNV